MRRTILLLAPLALFACSGEMAANLMPGTPVEVNGHNYTVQDTARGVTVQNFETGRTSPAVLMANAQIAAERVTGCAVDTIVKDGMSNTYYATTTCPA